MTVTIYGYGWVGKAMHVLFPDAQIVDPAQGFSSAVMVADAAFVCVPTPNLPNGALDVSIVADVVRRAPESFIVIRSTVMPGTTDALIAETGKALVFQPEYLGETIGHPLCDQKARPFLVLGGEPEARRQAIELYQQAYSANVSITQLSALEAEVVKLSENRAIAFKVGQCQELYDVCQRAGVDYYTVRDAVYGADPRFNLWWTFVFPDRRGFNSKCIPKDVYGWAAWAESVGYRPDLTRSLLETNEHYLAGQELERLSA